MIDDYHEAVLVFETVDDFRRFYSAYQRNVCEWGAKSFHSLITLRQTYGDELSGIVKSSNGVRLVIAARIIRIFDNVPFRTERT